MALMYQQALAAIAEKVINAALALDPNAEQLLAKLDGKSLLIKLTDISLEFHLTVATGQIVVTSLNAQADCQIDCSVNALSEIKNAESLTKLIKQDQLDLQGELAVAKQFVALTEQLDIDWQQQLANRIGDVPSYKLSQLFQFVKHKLDFAKSQISQDASEYLLYEKSLVCNQAQVQDFCRDVQTAARKADSLEQQIERLNARILQQK